ARGSWLPIPATPPVVQARRSRRRRQSPAPNPGIPTHLAPSSDIHHAEWAARVGKSKQVSGQFGGAPCAVIHSGFDNKVQRWSLSWRGFGDPPEHAQALSTGRTTR